MAIIFGSIRVEGSKVSRRCTCCGNWYTEEWTKEEMNYWRGCSYHDQGCMVDDFECPTCYDKE